MKKAHQLKREHHYVWANYLRNWSCDGKNVWYRTAKGKLICDSTRMVAKEKDFYKVTNLTSQDVLVIKGMLQDSDLNEMHLRFLDIVIFFQALESSKAQLSDDQNLHESLRAYKHNLVENIHTNYESGVKDILPALANRDWGRLEKEEDLFALYSFLGQQFTRTKSFKELTSLSISNHDNDEINIVKNSMESGWWFMSHALGVNIGFSFYKDRFRHNLCLLINNTKQAFITSDQPGINVHESVFGDDFTPPKDEELDLFYPLSPTVALMIARSGDYVGKEIELTLEQVEKLNIKTAKMSYKHIFGDSRDALKPYMKYVGYRHAQTKQLATDRSS
ncbi:DUF4238 domain-containing protein [Vibrio cyclitrophicus]|uniref:DUF4238 domain-containing protein n=1 Tax=Vibrio cyclitrophicus TaxID=47951 RepID=UPI000C833B7F|nr:DUF4238 domain-containing protein [Vibrio cyclitrophicus]PMH47847.1 hypothetical protein BCU67_20380 [Vibrio cyclitrophicus]